MRTAPDLLREYAPGEDLLAADVNAFVHAARQQVFGTVDGDVDQIVHDDVQTVARPTRVFNTSSFSCPYGGVLKPGARALHSGLDAIDVTRPDGTYVWKYLIAATKVPAGGFGWAWWLLNTKEEFALLGDTYNTSLEWGPKKDDFSLWPDRPGFLFVERTADGQGRVIQRIPPVIIGHATYPISHNGTGAVKVYGGATFGTDLLYSIPTCRNKGPDIGANGEVSVSLVCGQAVCAPLDCGS